jgi:transcriptional regulator with XRE-family HTH domain
MDAAHRRLSANLKALTKRRGWSMNQLADFAVIGRGYLSDIVNGRKSPSLRTLVKLAGALDMEVMDLLA